MTLFRAARFVQYSAAAKIRTFLDNRAMIFRCSRMPRVPSTVTDRGRAICAQDAVQPTAVGACVADASTPSRISYCFFL